MINNNKDATDSTMYNDLLNYLKETFNELENKKVVTDKNTSIKDNNMPIKEKTISMTESEFNTLIDAVIDDTIDEIITQLEEVEDTPITMASNDIYLPAYIDHIKFNGPATIIFWTDGTKTVSVCSKRDTYDYEKGIAMCMLKKLTGNGNFNDAFKLWSPDFSREEPETNEDVKVLKQLLTTKKLTDRQKQALRAILN